MRPRRGGGGSLSSSREQRRDQEEQAESSPSHDAIVIVVFRCGIGGVRIENFPPATAAEVVAFVVVVDRSHKTAATAPKQERRVVDDVDAIIHVIGRECASQRRRRRRDPRQTRQGRRRRRPRRARERRQEVHPPREVIVHDVDVVVVHLDLAGDGIDRVI